MNFKAFISKKNVMFVMGTFFVHKRQLLTQEMKILSLKYGQTLHFWGKIKYLEGL